MDNLPSKWLILCTRTLVENLSKRTIEKSHITVCCLMNKETLLTYTTNLHERSASNGRASCLRSARWAAIERLPNVHRAKSLGATAWWLLSRRSPSAQQIACSAIARRALVGISGVMESNLFAEWFHSIPSSSGHRNHGAPWEMARDNTYPLPKTTSDFVDCFLDQLVATQGYMSPIGPQCSRMLINFANRIIISQGNFKFFSPFHAQTAGLIIMSDMNQTYVPEITVCNKTLGFGRCLDGSCFELYRACDGYADCNDGYDEAGCEY